jgi:hypothetical protein
MADSGFSLLRLWRGQVPLDDAFWNYAVIGGIAVNVLTSGIFLLLITMDLPLAAFLVGYGLSLPYNLIAVIGVSRSATRDDADTTRAKIYPLITIAGMLLLSIT